MPKFHLIKAGDVLYDVRRSTGFHGGWDYWPVKVIEVSQENQTALCSWNHNKPTKYWPREIERLRRSYPGQKKREAIRTEREGGQ